MNSITTTQVKNGSITLPKSLQKKWKNAQIMILPSRDSVLIKRLELPRFSDMLDSMKTVGKKISRKDVDEAVASVRERR